MVRYYGRGAVDDKGQVAALFALAMALRAQGDPSTRGSDLPFRRRRRERWKWHAWRWCAAGIKADAAIVLEATEFHVVPAVRGAVWFELETYGRAGHSGNVAGQDQRPGQSF